MPLYMNKSKSKRGVSVKTGLIYLTESLCDIYDFPFYSKVKLKVKTGVFIIILLSYKMYVDVL